MYEAHFNLTRKPFAAYPEPDMLVWGEGHKMARTMLVYGLRATSGIVVITGEIGTGKTTLLNHLMQQDQSGHILGRLNGSVGLGDNVPAWVLFGFGMEGSVGNASDSLKTLTLYLSEAARAGRKAVLFVDEAQLLADVTIEELRLLSDIQLGGEPVLQLVLLGQPDLAKKLNQPSLLQFRQRIVSHYHLKAFTPQETLDYITARMEKAGGDVSLFAQDALDEIHRRTDGIPRRINVLCDTALVYTFAQDESVITRATLDRVAQDRDAHGLLEIN